MKVKNTVCRILRKELSNGNKAQVYTYLLPNCHISFTVLKTKPVFRKGEHINNYMVVRYRVIAPDTFFDVTVRKVFEERAAFLIYIRNTIASEERIHGKQ